MGQFFEKRFSAGKSLFGSGDGEFMAGTQDAFQTFNTRISGHVLSQHQFTGGFAQC
jgi:hypothetical protein